MMFFLKPMVYFLFIVLGFDLKRNLMGYKLNCNMEDGNRNALEYEIAM